MALARLRGVDRTIKAGNYEIAAGITLPQLLDKLTQGDVTQTALTVVEGATFADSQARAGGEPGVVKTVLDLPEAELMRASARDGASAEGWFFPDTYFFVAGSTDAALLARAYRLMRARLDAAWATRAPDLPLKALRGADPGVDRREGDRARRRPAADRVGVRQPPAAGMRLQTDPTVIYGMGERFDGNLRKRDLETDTPYNTYTRDGLPPTPIALPGQAVARRGHASAEHAVPVFRRARRRHVGVLGELRRPQPRRGKIPAGAR